MLAKAALKTVRGQSQIRQLKMKLSKEAKTKSKCFSLASLIKQPKGCPYQPKSTKLDLKEVLFLNRALLVQRTRELGLKSPEGKLWIRIACPSCLVLVDLKSLLGSYSQILQATWVLICKLVHQRRELTQIQVRVSLYPQANLKEA